MGRTFHPQLGVLDCSAILAQVDHLFLHLAAEIYTAYTRLSTLQGHELAHVLGEITHRETEQGASSGAPQVRTAPRARARERHSCSHVGFLRAHTGN